MYAHNSYDTYLKNFLQEDKILIAEYDKPLDVYRDALMSIYNYAQSNNKIFYINFFKGYHETNPQVTLDILENNYKDK